MAVKASTPTQPAPADLILPPVYTVGPGAIYVEREAWILMRIPESDALYAPGNLTVAGLAEPPPVTVIWSGRQKA